jgi:hypothetical protein
VRYGYTSAFSGGSSSTSGFGVNYLLGEVISIPSAMTLTALGSVVYTAGTHMILALYTNSGGAPGSLLASTASTTMVAGVMELPVANVTLAAGSYWIMGEYDGTGPTYTDDFCNCNTIDYISITYPSVPSPFPASPSTYTSGHFPYYVVGYE